MSVATLSPEFWRGKNVFLTGHTGFKGGWLALWLSQLGAKVHGYALTPPTTPNFFTVADVASCLETHTIADVRDAGALIKAMQKANPDIVFHLAAQALVRQSYATPVDTYATNVMGTVNLLEAIRSTPIVKAVVNVTTDKCYENIETLTPYTENDAMGGYDPYSSSKGCAEIVTSAYRQSFLAKADVAVATARAGNVIGGGDWADDRLIPDFLKAIDSNQSVIIRSPNAIRPWQHLLEPLFGYLLLAEQLYVNGQSFAEAWNFGPSDADARNVGWIVEKLGTHYPHAKWRIETDAQLHEANYLRLNSNKAHEKLGWLPRWSLDETLVKIADWHQQWCAGDNMHYLSLSQIAEYQRVVKG